MVALTCYALRRSSICCTAFDTLMTTKCGAGLSKEDGRTNLDNGPNCHVIAVMGPEVHN
ncbi:protein of unknown function [Hyphomicrobium sp. 1Nfss2.1]